MFKASVTLSLSFFIFLFFLSLPFGMLEILTFGKFDFFSRWVAPKMARALNWAFGKAPYWFLLLVGLIFTIWIITVTPYLAMTALAIYWVYWVIGVLTREVFGANKVQSVLKKSLGKVGAKAYITGTWSEGKTLLRKRAAAGKQRFFGLGESQADVVRDPNGSTSSFEPDILPNMSEQSRQMALGVDPHTLAKHSEE